jgi:hypothetical protein
MRKLFVSLFVLCACSQAWAQDWQIRAVCDLRKGIGINRGAECSLLASEVIMLLPEKAGPGNVAVLADFTDNMEKAGVNWEAPCRDQQHCPDSAYTIRYAFISKKMISIPRDKTFTALVCREGFSDTAPDDAACRVKLMKVLREMVTRARKEGSLLAVLKCGGAEGETIRPDGQGVAGYELVYAFVQLPDMLPMAGNDPKASAKFAMDQLAGPQEAAPVAGGKQGPGAQPAAAPASSGAKSPAVQTATAPASTTQPAPGVAPGSSPPQSPPPAYGTATGEIIMQVAALPSLVQAETVADRLSAKGIEATFERAEVNGKEVYRVLARGKGSPEAFKQRLAEMGYPGAIQRR